MSASETILCSACCAENAPGKRFCGDCGAALAAAGISGPVEEIRFVSVLFADVADFTELSAQLGLEAIKTLMDRVFERLYLVIARHGGVVDKYIGDCVMALFGAPIAHGDDAARAVRAALEILASLREMRGELEALGLPRVEMRVGIGTGPVIAGAVGAGPQRRYTVMGHPVNVAAHLQRQAPRGGVLISDGTHRRVRGLFDMRAVDDTEPPSFQVLAPRFGGLWLRPREILGSEVDLVGRAQELARLLDTAAACAREQRARVALLVGEPGVGKSRVVSELLAHLEQRSDALRVVGFADPFSADAPFSVVADAVRRKFELSVRTPPQQVLARVRTLLQQLGCDQLPGDDEILARVLGTPLAGRPPMEPALFAQRSRRLLVELLDRLSVQTPLVIVIEDLQWCDTATLDVVEHALQRLLDRPLMVLGVTRPEFFREHPSAFSEADVQQIHLGPLSADDVAELLDRALGPANRAQLEAMVSSALGNPYHIEELLRTLEERGVLVRRVTGWRLGPIPPDLELPAQVEAVTQVRIDGLSPAQRRLLREAAVFGGAFWDGALSALQPGYAASDLSALVTRELVAPIPKSRFEGEREYCFLHAAARDVAYRTIPESQRAPLHRAAAEWLHERAARVGALPPEDLALIAQQYEQGGAPRRAAALFQEAGDAAHERGAYEAALRHYTRTVELADTEEEQFAALTRRERVFNALGRWVEQQRDAEHLLALAPDDDERRVEGLLRAGRARLNRGVHDDAKAAFDEALTLARRLGLQEGSVRALRWLGIYHFNRSEHRQALPLLREALQLAEAEELSHLAAELAYELGVTVGTVGDYVQAVDVSRRALEMFREQGNRYQESFCLGNLGCFHVYLGEYDEAVEALERAAAIGHQLGIPLAEASAQANLGNARRCMGDPARAVALEEEARTVARRIGDIRLDTDTCLYAALAALDLGEIERGATLAAEALDLARRGGMAGSEAVALMAQARAELAREQPAASRATAAEAVAILDRVGSVEGFETEILLVHALACAALERGDAARAALARAHAEVMARAHTIADASRRERFLARVPVNVEILRLARGG